MPQLTTSLRIAEITELVSDEQLPLALRPETICALEDIGFLADPFTGQLWVDPAGPLGDFAFGMTLWRPSHAQLQP